VILRTGDAVLSEGRYGREPYDREGILLDRSATETGNAPVTLLESTVLIRAARMTALERPRSERCWPVRSG
jgi:hypothetical protein